MTTATYQIKLPQFEGPFDLLLFFIERDELDIYNIPIHAITREFLDYIQAQERLNIELSSEFILFVSTLMRIKAKMLLPRKELDAAGNEIDPRQELVDKILEYKRFKEASQRMAELEALRITMVRRGNLQQELNKIGEAASEGTEIQTLTMYKLMKTYEKVLKRQFERENKPQHVVYRYHYTMEKTRADVLQRVKSGRSLSFEKLFAVCNERIHAIFIFLNLLELVQQQFFTLVTGEGRNNFIVEWNPNRPPDMDLQANILYPSPN